MRVTFFATFERITCLYKKLYGASAEPNLTCATLPATAHENASPLSPLSPALTLRSDQSDQSTKQKCSPQEKSERRTATNTKRLAKNNHHLQASKQEHKHTHTATTAPWPSTHAPSHHPSSRARRRTHPSQVRFKRSTSTCLRCLFLRRKTSADTQV